MIEAYSFGPGEEDVISACQSSGCTPKERWEMNDFEPIKHRIKSHYISALGRRCSYCNRRIDIVDHDIWDLDHVFAKSLYPQWMFEPKNLVVACKPCNRAKGEKDVRRGSARVNFPNRSDSFRIVNPHFDRFEDHINVHGYVYQAKSEKGEVTIDTCNLLRFGRDLIDWDATLDPDPELNRILLNATGGDTDSQNAMWIINALRRAWYANSATEN